MDDTVTSREFGRYWRAAAVSGFGSYVTLFVLQTLVVLTLHGSTTQVGWLNAARWLPYLVVGLVVGALVDGRRRLRLMIGTDLAQAGLLAIIPLLWWLDVLSLPALLLVVVAYGTASVINGAATMSFLPRLVGRGDLQRAHARIDGADAVASTSGPALGGVLVSIVSAPAAVLFDSLTYLYSALTLRRIKIDEPPPRTGVTLRGVRADIVDGVRWAYGGSGLRPLAIATHGWFVGNAIVGVVLAPFAYLTLGLSALEFSLVGAVGGVGALVGTVVTTAVGRRLGTGRTIVLCHLISAVAVIVLLSAGRWAEGLVALLVGQGLYGLAMGMSNSHEMSYRQLVTPDELQARTNTTLRSFNRAIAMISAPVAGVLADGWGYRPMLGVATVVFALVAVGLFASPFRRATAPV